MQLLGRLLGHRVRVRSRLGRGSTFAIEVPISTSELTASEIGPSLNSGAAPELAKGAILIIDGDREVRELLELFLKQEGHSFFAAHDGAAALQAVQSGVISPDLILADFNLPHMTNGLAVATDVQEKLKRQIPVIIFTGDISLQTLSVLSAAGCVVMNKPVKLEELQIAIQHALAAAPPTAALAVRDGAGAPPQGEGS